MGGRTIPGQLPHGELRNAVVIVLAGGQGQRLVPLTNSMAKPAVRFGGAYRMIDFTLSNCINSGLRRIYLLTQYASSSLSRHIRKGWAPLLSDDLGEFIGLVPPQKTFADRWYDGRPMRCSRISSCCSRSVRAT